MSKRATITINNFAGGFSDDPRENSAYKFQSVEHFDIFSNPTRLTPYRSLEQDTSDGTDAQGMKQYDVRDFLYASSSPKLYALGKTAGGNTKIVYKTDATTSAWTLPTSSEGNATVRNGALVEYKDYLWGMQGTGQVFKWGPLSGTPSITNTAGSLGDSIASVAQGVIAKDDNLYLPYNNKIVRVNAGGTVQDAVLTLPSQFKITSICNYGNYLAIACAPVSIFNGVSKVFLWNLISPDVQEAIGWGEGELRILETIEGMLVGVTDRYLNNATGAGRGSFVIQTYSGGVPQVVKEVFTQALTGKSIPLSKAVKNNRLFFSAKIMTNSVGTEYLEGLWSFGRKNVNYPFALSLDIVDENVSAKGIQSFGTAANYFFIAHSENGTIDKTDDAPVYASTSVYESQILNFGDAYADKTLLSIKVSFRKLAVGESLTVKYRKDGDIAWTLVGTHSTTGTLAKAFLNVEATSVAFASGYEYEIRLESTGGLEITGLQAVARINETP